MNNDRRDNRRDDRGDFYYRSSSGARNGSTRSYGSSNVHQGVEGAAQNLIFQQEEWTEAKVEHVGIEIPITST